MSSVFQNSIFYQLLMDKKQQNETPLVLMGGVTGSHFSLQDHFIDKPFVVFDFETTGLNTKTARIIEIGAIKYHQKKEIARFSQLIDPGVFLSKEIVAITGIDDGMLKGKPPIQNVLPLFHDFLRGSIGVAHNAEFDVGMMVHESNRLGISCNYHVICTLKLARAFVKLESRSLDALSKHYNFIFESRHRAIGDILVTAEVLWKIFEEQTHLRTMADLDPFRESMV